MSERIWILGAPDPEMEAIERLLRECGETVRHATAPSGDRIRPGQQAAPIHIGDATSVYTVECDPPLACGEPEDEPDMGQVIIDGPRYMAVRCCVGISVIRIDHHRPGDPGYGRPPSEFLTASSLGQVISELARLGRLPWERVGCGSYDDPVGCKRGSLLPWYPHPGGGRVADLPLSSAEWRVCIVAPGETGGDWGADPSDWAVVPRDLVLTAAADHCLAAAYRGECPGVAPDDLMRWRAETRAKFQGRPVEDVLTDVERAREALRAAPEVSVGFNVDAPGCDYHRGEADAGCGDCDYEGGAILVRDLRQARLVTTVVVAPFAEGADVGASGTGDSFIVVFDGRPEGAWDEGDHHTFVSAHIPELPEAAVREGVCFLSQIRDRDGREKVVCQAGTPEQIRAFMEHWAPYEGLVNIYGDPARGFAGAYLTTEAP